MLATVDSTVEVIEWSECLMNIALWIIAGLLAAAFAASGATKLAPSKENSAASGFAEDFSPGVIKMIGALEVLAAVGLILPAALDIAPVFVPLAATGLVLLMIGAMVTHARRKEYQNIGVNVILLLLAAAVTWGRFGPYSL
jgi:uncharacterized membrane protein YphA (DoxX/SURF4 family)